jgi:DNA-binding transcriptional regulator GbsR (MarR family)
LSEEAIHEWTLADKRAIKGVNAVFRAEDRVKKAKAELFNAQLKAELERTRLLYEIAKACQLAKEAAQALNEAMDQCASILERAL